MCERRRTWRSVRRTCGTPSRCRVDTHATALFKSMTVDAISDLDLSYTPHSDHPGTQYKSRLKTGSANTNSAHTNSPSPPDPASRAVRANSPRTPRAVHVK